MTADAPRPTGLRHWGGFVLGGVAAAATDMAVLRLMTDLFGVSAFVARPLSIAVAMLVSWQINRRLTFAVTEPASLREFGRFAAVSWVAQAVNYIVFSLVLMLRPQTLQELAIIVASLVSMVFAYAGFRFGVFRRHGDGPTTLPGGQ